MFVFCFGEGVVLGGEEFLDICLGVGVVGEIVEKVIGLGGDFVDECVEMYEC